MAQYIDKDTLVAEIERRLNYRVESLKAINNGTFWDEDQNEEEFNKLLTSCAFNAAKNELFELKCLLDILEVKEVDLGTEQRIKDCPFRTVYCERFKPTIVECNGKCSLVIDYPKLKELKAQKGEEV